MSKSMTHPLTGQVYTTTPEGLVEVSDPATGQRGLFDAEAHWLSGDIRHADLQLAGWVGRLARRQAREAGAVADIPDADASDADASDAV